MKKNFLIFTLLASLVLAVLYTTSTLLFMSAQTAPAKPVILASIKPVQLIVKAIVGDTATVDLLLGPATNPHHYQLRPSEIKKLHSAGHFVWVGPEMEVFLPKILVASTTPNTALMQLLDMYDSEAAKLESEKGSNTPHHTEEQHLGHDHNDMHGKDPHIWLDPLLMAQISASLASILSEKYPHLKAEFDKNQRKFVANLETLTRDFKVKLQQIAKRPIFTAHNAFSRLAERFGLHIQDFVTNTPELRPGASHLQALQTKIGAYEAICFLQESLASPSYMNIIGKATVVKQTNVDILASDTQMSETGYALFISKVLSDIESCAKL